MTPSFVKKNTFLSSKTDTSETNWEAPNENLKLSIIELVLPFAEESRTILNRDGKMPWQITRSEDASRLLKPNLLPENLQNNIDTDVQG
jgi:hypothetical protein